MGWPQVFLSMHMSHTSVLMETRLTMHGLPHTKVRAMVCGQSGTDTVCPKMSPRLGANRICSHPFSHIERKHLRSATFFELVLQLISNNVKVVAFWRKNSINENKMAALSNGKVKKCSIYSGFCPFNCWSMSNWNQHDTNWTILIQPLKQEQNYLTILKRIVGWSDNW